MRERKLVGTWKEHSHTLFNSLAIWFPSIRILFTRQSIRFHLLSIFEVIIFRPSIFTSSSIFIFGWWCVELNHHRNHVQLIFKCDGFIVNGEKVSGAFIHFHNQMNDVTISISNKKLFFSSFFYISKCNWKPWGIWHKKGPFYWFCSAENGRFEWMAQRWLAL